MGDETDPVTDGTRDAVTSDGWLARRIYRVPEEFLPWLREHGAVPVPGEVEAPSAPGDPATGADGAATDDAEPVGRALEARGLAALRRALKAPGRVRESAFRLLAADAYLTWSAEALLDLEEPEGALQDLVRRVAREDR